MTANGKYGCLLDSYKLYNLYYEIGFLKLWEQMEAKILSISLYFF